MHNTPIMVLGSTASMSAMGLKLYWMVGMEESEVASVHCRPEETE